MSCNCLQQTAKTFKNGGTSCFVCRGELSGVPRLLAPKHMYPACSPLVEGATKNDPLEPMTAANQCIVAFVGDCAIDATEWEEACKAPVYDEVDVLKQCVNWPENEKGDSLFTIEDIELICQGHTCCIRFHSLTESAQPAPWMTEINGGK